MSLQLSSEQSIGDVWIAQLDRKRVPQARSSGCKSSVAVITAECSRPVAVLGFTFGGGQGQWGGHNCSWGWGTDLYCHSEPLLSSSKLCFIINFIVGLQGEAIIFTGPPVLPFEPPLFAAPRKSERQLMERAPSVVGHEAAIICQAPPLTATGEPDMPLCELDTISDG